jgi:recombination protein RecR
VKTNVFDRLVNNLSKLPGIGQRTAERLGYYLVKADLSYLTDLSTSIIEVHNEMQLCIHCFNVSSTNPCSVCSSNHRDGASLCIVESCQDLQKVEKTASFRGMYHVLHGLISPLQGITPDDLKIKELLRRIETSRVEEIILALNPTVEGEATSVYLASLIKSQGIKLSRIAYGIPMGHSLEFTDQVTLRKAFECRVLL